VTIHKRLARVIRKAERDWWGAEGESRRCSQEAFQALAVSAEFAAWLRERWAETSELCQHCEGNGAVYADGKAHYYSSGAPTTLCPSCSGSGRVGGFSITDAADELDPPKPAATEGQR